MRLHEVMGECEGEGRMCEELGFCMACIHYYQHNYAAKENPPHAPISENHLKNAAMRAVRCRVGHCSTGWGNLNEA